METVSTASPALNRAVLHVLGHASLHRGRPISDTWVDLVRDLDDGEARALPESLGLALPLLAGDRERLQLAVDVAVAFDLYEVAPHLVRLLDEGTDPDLVVAAASLAANPATPTEVLQRLRRVAAVAQLPAHRSRAFELRLDPTAPATTDLERLLRSQQWPGFASNGHHSPAPIVGVDVAMEPARWGLQLLTALHQAGATVRRIPRSVGHQVPIGWLGRSTPIVTASSRTIARVREWEQDVTGAQLVLLGPSGDAARSIPERLGVVKAPPASRDLFAELLKDIQALLPHGQRLRYAAAGLHPARVAEPLEEGAATLGAFTAREMAFLAAGRGRDEVYRFGRTVRGLRPRKVDGFAYWRFNQVVALRTYNFFRTLTGRRVPGDVIGTLAEYGGRQQETQVAVTATGRVIEVSNDEEMYDVKSRQSVMGPVVRLDDVFQPFTLGGGRTFPDLLQPGPHSRVHPAILGGTPVVAGTRIACKAVARLERAHGVEAAGHAYPALSDSEVRDAVHVGQQVLDRS